MAWTYDGTDIETDLNYVRLRVGDTDTNDQQLTDEEITSLLAMTDNKILAASWAANMICAKYSRYGAMKEAEAFRLLAGEIYAEAGPQYL
jgi:hypothetical protein